MKINLDSVTRIVTDIFVTMTRIVMDLKKNSMKIDLDSITRIVTDIFCHNDKNCH